MGKVRPNDEFDATTGGFLVLDNQQVSEDNCNASFAQHGLNPEKINEAGADGTNRP